MNDLNIAFAPDNNYVVHCATAINSILINKSLEDNIHFYILDGGLTDTNRNKLNTLVEGQKNCILNFIKVDDKQFSKYNTPLWGTAAAYRLKLPSLVPNLDRILYLDCDIIVKDSLKELYFNDLEKNYIGMIPD